MKFAKFIWNKNRINWTFSFSAADEIDEVDSIMEDITDEIMDLQESMNVSKVPCTVSNTKEVNCNSTIYKDRLAWRSSRAYVNEQIRRLRSQLHELKEIRHHLRIKRPGQFKGIMESGQLDGDDILPGIRVYSKLKS